MEFPNCHTSGSVVNPSQVREGRVKSPVPIENVPGISLYPSQFHLQEISSSEVQMQN